MEGFSIVWSSWNWEVILGQGCCNWSRLNIFQVYIRHCAMNCFNRPLEHIFSQLMLPISLLSENNPPAQCWFSYNVRFLFLFLFFVRACVFVCVSVKNVLLLMIGCLIFCALIDSFCQMESNWPYRFQLAHGFFPKRWVDGNIVLSGNWLLVPSSSCLFSCIVTKGSKLIARVLHLCTARSLVLRLVHN